MNASLRVARSDALISRVPLISARLESADLGAGLGADPSYDSILSAKQSRAIQGK